MSPLTPVNLGEVRPMNEQEFPGPSEHHQHALDAAASGPSRKRRRCARAAELISVNGAVYRYLLAGVRDPEIAADLGQEFAVRFLEGRFVRADPTAAASAITSRLAVPSSGRLPSPPGQTAAQVASLEYEEPAAPEESLPGEDQAFRDSWREELLVRAWLALSPRGAGVRSTLLSRPPLPRGTCELSTSQMAEQLSVQLGKPMTAAGVRQLLYRARDRFAELLLDEVRQSLGPSGRDYLRRGIGRTQPAEILSDTFRQTSAAGRGMIELGRYFASHSGALP